MKNKKWYLTCVSSYNLESIFRSGPSEGPKSSLIVNGNQQRSENNYDNCYYLDLDLQRSKADINSLLVVTIDTQKVHEL